MAIINDENYRKICEELKEHPSLADKPQVKRVGLSFGYTNPFGDDMPCPVGVLKKALDEYKKNMEARTAVLIKEFAAADMYRRAIDNDKKMLAGIRSASDIEKLKAAQVTGKAIFGTTDRDRYLKGDWITGAKSERLSTASIMGSFDHLTNEYRKRLIDEGRLIKIAGIDLFSISLCEGGTDYPIVQPVEDTPPDDAFEQYQDVNWFK